MKLATTSPCRHPLSILQAALALLALGATSTHAAVVTWNDDAIGDWHDDSKWVGGTAPLDTDQGRVNSGHSTFASTDAATAVNQVQVGFAAGQSGTVTVTGNLNAGSGTVIIGGGGSGLLDIKQSGTVADGVGLVGNAVASSGTVIVAGVWANTSTVSVGFVGNGLLEIKESGTVTGQNIWVGQQAEGSGTAVVSGVMYVTTNIFVGGSGNGYIHITPSGTVTANLFYVGRYPGGYSTLEVDGYFGQRGSSTPFIGHEGSGMIKVGASGTVIIPTPVAIGQTANTSSGGLYVAGYWQSGAQLQVGNSGTGFLEIATTGTVTNSYSAIGANATASGTAFVAGLWQLSSYLTVGQSGVGRLEVASTGTIIVGGSFSLNARSSLAVALDASRATPHISCSAAAILTGTLLVSGLDQIGYFSDAAENKASDLSALAILRARNGITNDFSAIAPAAPAILPDFLQLAGAKDNEGGPTAIRYDVGCDLAWNASISLAHGTFTVGAAKTFHLDVPLADRSSTTFTSGWDGRSLVKQGAGTLVLEDGNTSAGTTTVQAGVLVAGGVFAGPVVNNATIELTGASCTFGSLSGSGTLRMSFDPAAGTSDKLIVLGNASGAFVLDITLTGTPDAVPLNANALQNLISVQGTNTAAFTGAFTYGAFTYTVGKAPDGSLVLGGDAIGSGGAPVITSPSTATGMVGVPFDYTITAVNSPDSYDITGSLPPGLARSGALNESITGTPTTLGNYPLTLHAVNASGTGTAPLTITITPSGTTIPGGGSLYWDGGEGGWLDGPSWHEGSPAGPVGFLPTSADNVFIESGRVLVAAAISGSFKQLNLGALAGGSGTISVQGGLTGTEACIGNSGAGILVVEPGGLMTTTTRFHVGKEVASTGTVSISGAITATGTVAIGHAGQGALAIENGGTLSVTTTGTSFVVGGAAGGNGMLTIKSGGLLASSGAGMFYVGNASGATGALNIEPSGTFRAGSTIRIGNVASATGTASIAGSYLGGSTGFVLGGVNAGSRGHGSVTILPGGSVTAGTVYVGEYGTGVLHIAEGGLLVNSANSWVPRYTGGSGTATIAGNWRTASYIVIGNGGSGGGTVIFDIAPTGAVYASDVRIGGEGVVSNRAIVNVAGLLEGTDSYVYAGSGSSSVTVLNISPTGIVRAATDGAVGNATNSSGTANVAGLWQVGANFINGSAAANATGFLNIADTGAVLATGNYTQNTRSTLAITIDPARPDALHIVAGGAATLAGALRVSGMSGVAGAVTDKSSDLVSVAILRADGGITGDFATVDTDAPATGASMPDYIYNGKFILYGIEYRIGHTLAWNAPSANGHGTFNIASGNTYTVDTPLADCAGPFASGWDGRSLVKRGPGTLILAAPGTRTGDTTIEAGTLRITTAASLGNLINNATLDLGGSPAGGYHMIEASSFAGAGTLRLSINPAADTGDRLIIHGNAQGTQTLSITIDGPQTGPLDPALLDNILTVKGSNTAIINGTFTYNGVTHSLTQHPDGSIAISNNTITATLDPQGGSLGAQPSTKSVVQGQPYGLLPSPARAGYIFSGWWTGVGGAGSQVTPDTTVTATGPHTLYARWMTVPGAPAGETITVTFSPQGGSVSPISKTVNQGAAYGALPDPVRANATFDGWFTDPAGGTQVTAATTVAATAASHILYARWTVTTPSTPPQPVEEIRVRPAPSMPGAFRVLTANLRGYAGGDADPSKIEDSYDDTSDYHTDPAKQAAKPRRAVLREVILAQKADIYCFQECYWYQANDFLTQMPGYAGFKYSRTSSSNASTGDSGCAILYNTALFEVIESDHFWLNTHPRTFGYYPTIGSHRDATWVKMREKNSGREFIIWFTHIQHGDANYTADANNEARQYELQMILQAAALHPAGTPQLMLADFNLGITQPVPILNLVQVAGWHDTYARVNTPADPGFTYHGFRGEAYVGANRYKIDHIFARGPILTHAAEVIKDYKTVGATKRYPSDHYFVSADISFDTTAPVIAPATITSVDQTPFASPSGVALNGATLYVSDAGNNNIRTGTTAYAGSTTGAPGNTNDTGPAARFAAPLGLAWQSNNLYIADSANRSIRRIDTATAAATLSSGGDTTPGAADGASATARYALPADIAIAPDGTLYVADSDAHAIRKIDPSTGEVTTIAGALGTPGTTNGAGSAARFNKPLALALDAATNTLYVADSANNSIRKIDLATNTVTTVTDPSSPQAPSLQNPSGLAFASGTLYIADTASHAIRALNTATGVLTLLAGNPAEPTLYYPDTTVAGAAGPYTVPAAPVLYTADGTGTAARFNNPTALTLDAAAQNLYVADSGNRVVRVIALATGIVTTTGSNARIRPDFSLILSGSTAPSTGGPDTITITFDAGAGSVTPTTKTIAKGASYGSGGAWPIPVRDGHSFAGWWTGSGGTDAQITAATLVPENAVNQTLYAKWIAATPGSPGNPGSEITITVTFDPQGGSVSTSAKTIVQGAPYGALPVPSLDGNIFNGWFTDPAAGAQVTPETLTAANATDHTLHAQWTAATPGVPGATTTTSGTTYPEPVIRQVIDGTGDMIAYQFHNTSPNPALATAASRSGVFSYADTNFFITPGGFPATDGAGITAFGESAAGTHPVTLIGTNINSTILLAGAEDNRQAVAVRHGAKVYLYGGSLSRTGGAASETIHIAGNTTGGAALFHGEDLSIIARDSASEAVYIGSGPASFTLKRGKIFSENTTINTIGVPSFFIDSGAGHRAIALDGVTIATTSALHAPGLQSNGGSATLSWTGGAINTTGQHSPGMFFLTGNANDGQTAIDAFLDNVTITAAASAGIDWNYQADYAGFTMGNKQTLAPKPAGAAAIYDIRLANSRVYGALASVRVAAAGSFNNPYAEHIRIRLLDTVLDGAVRMTAGLPAGDQPSTSGATLELTGAGSTLNGGIFIDGAPSALRSHAAIINLARSTLNGGITTTGRGGDIDITLADTPVIGAYAFAGNSAILATHVRSTIAGGLTATDTTLAAVTLLEGSSILGGISLDGRATATVTLGDAAAINGPITLAGNALLTLIAANDSTLAGDISINENASLEIETAGAAITINGNATLNGASLRLPEKTTLNGTLDITNPAAVITISTAGNGSLVLAAGITGSGRLVVESIAADAIGQADIHVIRDLTGAMSAAAFAAITPIHLGFATYIPEIRPDGVHFILTPVAPGITTGNDLPATTDISSGTVLISVPATAGEPPMFYQWQTSTNAGVTWADIAGATNATLALIGLSAADNGKLYRVIITNSAGTIISAATSLTGGSGEPPPPPVLEVDKTMLSLEQPAGSSGTFSVTAAHVTWTASATDSWLAVFPDSGGAGVTAVTVTATTGNTTGSPRTTTVTIDGTYLTQNVVVTQQAISGDTIAPPYLATGATLQFNIAPGITETYTVAAGNKLNPVGGTGAIPVPFEYALISAENGTLIFDDTVWTLNFATRTFSFLVSGPGGSRELTGTFAYTVVATFHPNAAGVNLTPVSATVSPGLPYGVLPEPIRPGTTFEGWFTSATGGTRVTAATPVPTNAGNHTLYARWTTNPGGGSDGGGGGAPSLLFLPALALLFVLRRKFGTQSASANPTPLMKTLRPSTFALVFCAFLGLGAANTLNAASYYWDENAVGDWYESSLWHNGSATGATGEVPPGTGNNAYINSGQVTFAGNAAAALVTQVQLGVAAGQSGTLTVTGNFWNSTATIIGNVGGNGLLEIKAGASYRNGASALANNASSTGRVTVEGTWNTTDYINVGASGIGILDIRSGGLVTTTGYVSLGNTAATASGTLLVADGGRLQTSSTLIIGATGTGFADIKAGATVSAAYTVIGRAASTGAGTLVLNGGVLETRQISRGAGAATITFNSGTIRAIAEASDFFSNFPVLDLASGALALDTQAFSVTATNALSSAATATLDKHGSGALTLTADSSAFGGAFNVRAGSLVLSAGAKLGGTITVAAGAVIRPAPASSSTVNNLVINSGATLDMRSAPLTAAGNLTFDNGAIWNYSLTGTHAIDILGTLAFDGSGTLMLDRDTLPFASIPGSYTLATYNTLTGASNLASWSITGADFSVGAVFDTTSLPGSLVLNINTAGSAIDVLRWQGGDGEWNSANTVWRSNGTSVAWIDNALGVFDTGSGAVTVTDLQQFSTLQFDTNGYTLAGTGTLTSSGTANINTTAASATTTINTAIIAPGLYKAGPGSLVLGGPATLSGAATIDAGTLEIANTGSVTVADITTIGNAANSSGTLAVAGYFAPVGNITIGNSGAGWLNVANSGTVNAGATTYIGGTNGTGFVTIAGVYENASNFSVGQFSGGAGCLTIQNGGTLNVRGGSGSYIGNNADASGTAIIAGAWQNTNLFVGNSGNGHLEIKQTGVVTNSGYTLVGNLANSNGTAIISGLMQNAAYLQVGVYGDGHVRITETGSLSASYFFVGRYIGGNGVLEVDGYLNRTASTTTMIGHEGRGELLIGPTGVVVGTSPVGIGQTNTTDSRGRAYVAGLWQEAAQIQVGNNSVGVLEIATTGTVRNSYSAIGANATGSGTAIVAGLWNLSGNLTNGQSGVGFLEVKATGTILAGGNYVQNSRSSLSIELNASRPDAHITISGNAAISGTLFVSGLDQLNYSGGDGKASDLRGVTILRAPGGITGDFERIVVVGSGGNTTITPDYISFAGMRVSDGGPLPTRYDLGYGLAWQSTAELAHGTFTIDEGTTFNVDVQLNNRIGIESGWDGKSLTKKGAGTLILSVENTYSGATTVEAGTLRFEGPANARLGDLVNNGTVDLGGTGKRTLRADSLAGSGAFRMTVDLAAGASDRIIIAGDASGAHRLLLTGVGGMPVGDEPMPTLISIGGVNDTSISAGIELPGGATFEGSFDYGAFNYAVEMHGNNVVIVNTGLQPAAYDPIHGVAGAQSILWFDQQDNLHRRIGELRAYRENGSGPDLWVRGNFARATIGGGDTGMRRSDVNLWGVELGLDYTSQFDTGRATIGVFVGVGNTSQTFDDIPTASSATGKSKLISAGLYAAWVANYGLFANATLAGNYYQNTFDAADLSRNHTTGDYTDIGIGASVETGWRIELNNGWFVEPAIQGAITHINRGNYTTGGLGSAPLSVHGSDATIARLRGIARLGRVWQNERVGWLELAGRAAITNESSTGGEIAIGNATRARPNLDGNRHEAGLSLYWRPAGRSGQIYLDYEYASGDNYKKPWAFSFGFRFFFH